MPADLSVFDELVSGLSSVERRELLAKMGNASLSQDPLFESGNYEEAPLDYQAAYAELGLFRKFLVWLRSLFSGKKKDEIVREIVLEKLAKKLEAHSIGLVDFRQELLLESFLDHLVKLKAASRFFYEILTMSLDKDKAAFSAFLVSLEMEDYHQRLILETDPVKRTADSSLLTPQELRASIVASFEEIVASIPEERRRVMYRDFRCLYMLKRLSAFLFDRMIAEFSRDRYGRTTCPFTVASESLSELADILSSFSAPPTVKLLESMFLFARKDAMKDESFDAEAAIKEALARAEDAINRIRSFNKDVALLLLVRLTRKDPAWAPKEQSGGEDWFALFKSFWKDRIERGIKAFEAQRREMELEREVGEFLGKTSLPGYPHLSPEETDESPPVRLAKSIAFMEAFYRAAFLGDLNRPLKLILLEGEFYKKDNRLEFIEAYNDILRLPDAVQALDRLLSSEGDLGTAWAQARTEMVSFQIRRRKLQSIAQSAETEAETLIRASAEALRKLCMILKGIVKGEAGGRYDSLSNLRYIEGRGNEAFVRSLDSARERLVRALGILAEMSGLELQRPE